MQQLTSRFVALLLTLCAVCVIAKSPRNDKMFHQYPLAEPLRRLFSMQTTQTSHISDHTAYTRAALDSIHHVEEERIHNLMESSTSTGSRSLPRKPMWFGYYHEVPIPSLFHAYDAESITIHGTADLPRLNQIISTKENYGPVSLARTNRGIVTIQITKYKDTSMGSDSFEVVLSASVAPRVSSHRIPLGVSYEENNFASILYPLFGKLPDHHRNFVLERFDTHATSSKGFWGLVFGYPENEAHDGQLDQDGSITRFKMSQHSKPIISGHISKPITWKEWFFTKSQTAYEIVKALGLSGIIDLWYAKHVPLKYVSRLSQGGRLVDHFINFRKMDVRPWDSKKDVLEFSENESIGRMLKELKFEPKYVTHMPVFQSVVGVPKEQIEDTDWRTTTLDREDL